jgi:hypothetical protein
MANLSVTATAVRVVESGIQMTGPVDEAINAGVPIRFAPSTGKFTKAKTGWSRLVK